MPYEIRELLSGLPKPITAEPGEALLDALNRMLEHGYSQLPVVKGKGQSAQFYLITSQEILKKLKFFGLPIDGKGLKVEHALIKIPRVFTPDDTITDVMDGLKEMDAVLIVNEQRELEKIVTIYDTTHFFRRWSEDLPNAREVEMFLRRVITGAFRRSDGMVDEEARQKAINGADGDDNDTNGKTGYKRFSEAVKHYLSEQAKQNTDIDPRKAYEAFKILIDTKSLQQIDGISISENVQPDQGQNLTKSTSQATNNITISQIDATKDLKNRFNAAIRRYIELSRTSTEPNNSWINNAYKQYYQSKQEPKSFNKLTLGSYIELFFKDQCWGRFGNVFDLEQQVVKRVLESVQEVRNLLAHFREEEITEEHRRNLRLAAEWLTQYEKQALLKLEETAPLAPIEVNDLPLIDASLSDQPTSDQPS